MKNLVIALGLCIFLLVGCGDSGGSSDLVGPITPTSFVNMNGTLTAPKTIEQDLLGNTLQNTDSPVRNAFASATVYVNGTQITTFVINPLYSNENWKFSLTSVPASTTGKYKIDVITGRINLKSWVSDAEKDTFKINLNTTAAALLSNATGYDQNTLLETYPSFVTNIENDLVAAAKLPITSLTGTIVQSASITQKLASNTLFFKNTINFTPEENVAYLSKENDINGDGIIDLKIQQSVDGTRIQIFTVLSSATSMLSDIASISQYTDTNLLKDFKDGSTITTRTFDATASRIALGLYMKKSATADVYIKLLIRKVDITNGTFNGVLAEYSFVNTATTAIASGTKHIMLSGRTPVGGAIISTNFVSDITDTTASPYSLAFLNTTDGIGCSSGNTPMIKAKDGDGTSELTGFSYAEKYADGGGNYFTNTRLALNDIYKNRGPKEGDVFSAYFPNTKNYALFKIIEINGDSVKIDYIINTAEDENLF